MRVLALDSTTRAGSAAIVDDDRVVVERRGDDSRPHAERLPGELLDLGVPLSSVDLFAIACGPGSFTGLRIGIATIQGLAFARRARVAAISALEALGQVGSLELPAGAVVGVWMDAYRQEVFSALYRVGRAADFSDQRLTEIDAPGAGAPSATLTRWMDAGQTPALIVGEGAVRYAGVVGEHARVMAPPLLAGAIGCMAVRRAKSGHTLDPAGVQPLYIRRPDVEVARARGDSLDR